MESSTEDQSGQSAEASSKAEVFSIGEVAELTGLSEATLRVWERRYRFPTTERSAGGHRQYRQRDVIDLQWVKSRLDDGMRAHRAIEALGRAQTAPRALALDAAQRDAVGSVSVTPTSHEGVTNYRLPLLNALLDFDAEASDRLLNEAAAQYPLEQVVLELVGPILHDIGLMWSNGRITVAAEHFASHYLRQRLAVWIDAHPPAFHVRPVVLVCAPGEMHEGSLLMLGVVLGRRRWPILYLGQSLPLDEIPTLVANVRPAAIIFVAMTQSSAQTLRDWPRWLASTTEPTGELKPVVCFGGAAFSDDAELVSDFPGLWLGKTVGAGCERIHRLLLDTNVTRV